MTEREDHAVLQNVCGCESPAAAKPPRDGASEGVERWWRIRDIQFGLVAGAFLLVGFVFGQLGWETAALILSIVALLVGASTFVPGAMKTLVRGRVGVGLLMTIGAVGATLLGQVEEAAMLAFLFSVAEGLEDYSIAKTRHGLT